MCRPARPDLAMLYRGFMLKVKDDSIRCRALQLAGIFLVFLVTVFETVSHIAQAYLEHSV